MDFNKLPRWALVYGFLGFMSLGGVMLKGAFADLDETKQRALRTEQETRELSKSMSEVKEVLKDLSGKFDRNQEENQRVFRQILSKVS